LPAGLVVGRYRIAKLLGKGTMGEVFLAVDEQLGRRAAIKALGHKHLKNETIRERFLREARALAGLTHPNLITVYESGFITDTDRPYFAMELLEGGDTQMLVNEHGPLPSGVVAAIGSQAAAGLAEAARAGIIHRDVKPANLGLSARGALKVTDFSLAKAVAVDKSLTAKGMVVGTADYMAPEQARGEPIDERADVYALGCTLFHLTTGKPPFRCEVGTEVQKYLDVMKAHLTEPIPDPRRFAKDVDPTLTRVIARTMDKNREKRPTFAELEPILKEIADALGGEIPRVTKGVPVVQEAKPRSAAERRREITELTDLVAGPVLTRKRLVLLIGLGVVLGAGLAVALTLLLVR
jgi:serine/threonine-protein kinase